MEGLGRLLIIAGAFIMLAGLLFLFWDKIPLLGRLPGDITLNRGGWRIFFPIATSLLLSITLTIVINVAFRLFR